MKLFRPQAYSPLHRSGHVNSTRVDCDYPQALQSTVPVETGTAGDAVPGGYRESGCGSIVELMGT
eukprot:523163-Hanusia_phi.AAC.1